MPKRADARKRFSPTGGNRKPMIVATIGRLAEHPIGWSDSLGHPVLVSDFEKRLIREPRSRAVIFAAAVSNHYAGNFDRARQLYERLGNDGRARRNLTALQQRSFPAVSLSPDDLYNAYVGAPWYHRMLRLPDDLSRGVPTPEATQNILAALLVVIVCALPLILMIGVRSSPALAEGDRLDKRDSTPMRLLMLVVPGLYDFRRGALWRTLIIAFGIGVAILPITAYLKFGSFPVVGMFTGEAIPNIYNAFPLPFTPEQTPQQYAHDVRLVAFPQAATFYGLVAVAAAAAVLLHLARLPAILRRQRSGAAPLVPAPPAEA